ncbi:MAG: HAD family hydrolase [Bacteroidota bacterium]
MKKISAFGGGKRKLAVIFDMDGVIVDNAAFHFEAWGEFCAKKGLEFNREEFRGWFGSTNREILARLYGRKVSRQEAVKLGEEKEAIYRQIYEPVLSPVHGLAYFLNELKRYNFKLAVATSAPPKNVDFVLSNSHTRKYFDAIVDASGVRHGKPSPEIYLKASRKLRIKPQNCLVFEDAFYGIEAARNARMKVIGVGTTHKAEELKGTEMNIHDFSQVTAEMVAVILNS